MTPREIIAKVIEPQAWAALGLGDKLAYLNRRTSSERKATRILEALHSAGYRILGPGEWDAETLEKYAEFAEEYASYEQTEWGMGHRDACNSIATDLRALAKEKQG